LGQGKVAVVPRSTASRASSANPTLANLFT
jgi:hypothetical protein